VGLSASMEKDVVIEYGTGSHTRAINIRPIADYFGENAAGLCFLNTITGCDTVSSILGVGKKTALKVGLQGDFLKIFANFDHQLFDSQISTMEKYVCKLFSEKTDLSLVNDLRKHMFGCGTPIDRLPPTKAAFDEHCKRAGLQTHVWLNSLEAQPLLLDPKNWGWVLDEISSTYSPLWTPLPMLSEVSIHFTKCGCVKGCQKNCGCKKKRVNCSSLCKCKNNHGDS